MKIIGPQIRETLAQAGYTLVAQRDGLALVRNEVGGHEIYTEHDLYPGYVVEIGDVGHRFLGTPATEKMLDFFCRR